MNENMKVKWFDEEIEVYDEKRVVNKTTNTITLNYIPSTTRPIIVENKGIMLTETNGIPSQNQFVADRENGLLLFNSAMSGKVMVINYAAIGQWCVSAEKIYTNVDNKGSVLETLEDIIRCGNEAISSIGVIGDSAKISAQLRKDVDVMTSIAPYIYNAKDFNSELVINTNEANKANTESKKILTDMNEWIVNNSDVVSINSRLATVEESVNDAYCSIHFLNTLKQDGTIELGDCILIKTPSENILVDSGEASALNSVLNNLNTLGVSKLDTIILTHWHSDHSANMPEIIKRYGCKKFISKVPVWGRLPQVEIGWDTQGMYNRTKAELDKIGVSISIASELDTTDYNIKIYNTDDKTTSGTISDYNRESMMVKVVFKKSELSALLCGDCPNSIFNSFIDGIGKVDVLKTPHHNDNNFIAFNEILKFSPKHIICNKYDNNWSYKNYITGNMIGAKNFAIGSNAMCISYIGCFNNNNAINEIKFYNSWARLGEYFYYYDNNGELLKNCKRLISYGDNDTKEGYFVFNEYGEMVKNMWINNISYAKPNGVLCRNEVYNTGSNYYGFDDNGVVLPRNTVNKIGDKYYYCHDNSEIYKSKGYILVSGKYYCCTESGELIANKWSSNLKDDSTRYYCYHDDNGVMLTSARIFYNGKFMDLGSDGITTVKPEVGSEQEIFYIN